GQVTSLADKLEVAEAAFRRQQEMQQAARAATEAFNRALDAAVTAGADIIQQVRVKGRTDGEKVFQLAWIPAPDKPSAIGLPGTPTEFQFKLRQTGEVEL